jgi:phosphate ABC transporter ATP-binding protein
MENPMSNETAFEVQQTKVIDHVTDAESESVETAVMSTTPAAAERRRAFRAWRRASAPQAAPTAAEQSDEAATADEVEPAPADDAPPVEVEPAPADDAPTGDATHEDSADAAIAEADEQSAPTVEAPAADSDGATPTKVAVHMGVETFLVDKGAAPAPIETAPTAPLAVLDAVAISAWFGERKVLDRVSLTMEAGKITALIGPSGCGKSTFLRILNRMHEMIPSASLAGEVLLDGEDVYGPSRRLTDARRNIGMVFQKPNPFPAMSIYDNVIAGLKLTGVNAGRDTKDYLVESSLTKAGLWKEVRDRLRQPGGGLSGGQQQRLCIARSLAIKPRVLLMDEPCSALDPTSTRVIEETMLELAKEVTIVIVTHNMQQAQRVSDNCAFFLAAQGTPGNIVEQGDTAVMFESPTDSRTFEYVNGRFG